jgi:leishmanolysin
MKTLAATVLIALALTGLVTAHSLDDFECNHNTDDFTLGVPDESEIGDHNRRMLAATYTPLRITFDFSRLSTLSANQQDTIQKTVKQAANFFKKVLSVPSTTTKNMIPSGQSTCGTEITFSSSDKTNGFANSDLHLYVTFVNNPSSSYLAYASPCSLNNNYRPNTGKVVFNSAYLASSYSTAAAFNGLFKIVSHEMTHVMGFSQSLYSYFLDPSNNNKPYYMSSVTKIFTTSAEGYPIIKSANVLSYARTYYGCATLQGMRLEDEGSAGSTGSHWERSVLQNEYMTASAIGNEAVISGFTLNLLKDSGWY